MSDKYESTARDDAAFDAHARRTKSATIDVGTSRPIAPHDIDHRAEDSDADTRELLLTPVPERSEPDAPISATVVTTIDDIIAAVANGATIVATDNTRVLDFLREFGIDIGVTPMVLAGFPTATYSAIWDQKTFGYDRVSYDTLVAEVVTTARVTDLNSRDAGANGKNSEAARRAARATRPLKDLGVVSRKEFTDFETHALSEEPQDASHE